VFAGIVTLAELTVLVVWKYEPACQLIPMRLVWGFPVWALVVTTRGRSGSNWYTPSTQAPPVNVTSGGWG
jgi:hypothetical protein